MQVMVSVRQGLPSGHTDLCPAKPISSALPRPLDRRQADRSSDLIQPTMRSKHLALPAVLGMQSPSRSRATAHVLDGLSITSVERNNVISRLGFVQD